MKKSELKTIIKEEYTTSKSKSMIVESIVEKMIALFLTPKINKEVKKYKKTPEYLELERQAKLAVKELEVISNKLERAYKDRDDAHKELVALEKQAKAHGVAYKAGMSVDQIRSLFEPSYRKIKK